MKFLLVFLMMVSINVETLAADQNRGEKAPKVGDVLPDIKIGDKKLSEHLKSGRVLLTVYRGGWCPYCIKQLKNYQANLDKFNKKDIQVVAVSPDTKKNVAKTKDKNGIKFTMLSDKNHQMLRSLNLVFKLDDETVKKYKGYGIDLVESQGNNKNELPIPAVYLINNERRIVYAFVDFDYKNRATVEAILAAADDK